MMNNARCDILFSESSWMNTSGYASSCGTASLADDSYAFLEIPSEVRQKISHAFHEQFMDKFQRLEIVQTSENKVCLTPKGLKQFIDTKSVLQDCFYSIYTYFQDTKEDYWDRLPVLGRRALAFAFTAPQYARSWEVIIHNRFPCDWSIAHIDHLFDVCVALPTFFARDDAQGNRSNKTLQAYCNDSGCWDGQEELGQRATQVALTTPHNAQELRTHDLLSRNSFVAHADNLRNICVGTSFERDHSQCNGRYKTILGEEALSNQPTASTDFIAQNRVRDEINRLSQAAYTTLREIWATCHLDDDFTPEHRTLFDSAETYLERIALHLRDHPLWRYVLAYQLDREGNESYAYGT